MLKPTPQVKSSGEPGARTLGLRQLFEQEESALLRFAFSLVGRREVAEEIVQEAFLQLHTRWDEVDAPKSWLFRSVRNRAFNHLRDHRREIFGGDPSDESTHTGDETPDALMQRMESLLALRRTLEELDDSDQQLVKLKYFEQLKYREISERTELSVSNVGYRLHHILRELANKLRRLGIDGNP